MHMWPMNEDKEADVLVDGLNDILVVEDGMPPPPPPAPSAPGGAGGDGALLPFVMLLGLSY